MEAEEKAEKKGFQKWYVFERCLFLERQEHAKSSFEFEPWIGTFAIFIHLLFSLLFSFLSIYLFVMFSTFSIGLVLCLIFNFLFDVNVIMHNFLC